MILFACLSFSPLLAQTKEEYLQNVKDYMESISDQKIPADFFLGEWGGTIHGEIVTSEPKKHYLFEIEFIGHPARHGLGPTSGGAEALMKITATWPNKFTICDTVGCMILPSHNSFIFQYPVTEGTITELTYNTIFYNAGFDIEVKNNNLISISSGGVDPDMWEKSWAKGELHRIYVEKDTLGKTVFEHDPLKTDKFTQKNIVIPEVGEVKVKPQSECKFNNENSIDHWKGTLRHKIKKMSEAGANFEIISPHTSGAVRGTEFITIVKKNSTTLKVFEGQVAFTDINNKKTVMVIKNQMSTVKAGGVPSDPKEMDLAAKWFSLH